MPPQQPVLRHLVSVVYAVELPNDCRRSEDEVVRAVEENLLATEAECRGEATLKLPNYGGSVTARISVVSVRAHL